MVASKGRKGFEGVFFSKLLIGIAIGIGILVFAKQGIGLWTAALVALIFLFYMGFSDPRGDYPQNKYKVK